MKFAWLVLRWECARRGPSKLRLSSVAAFASAVAACGVAGCVSLPKDIGTEPKLSPIGAGINQVASRAEVASQKDGAAAAYGNAQQARETGSLWRDRGADLFRDARARRRGDLLTVTISIKDKASLDNSSKRSRDSAIGMGFDYSHAIALPGLASEGSATANGTVNSNTSTDGKGAVARSESIELRVAAVVTGTLGNGNLVIEGSQEIRVNYELRVLTVSGIVNIADIRADNTIAYDRIAEARMSYGGRGRVMEVQQPGWLHQITDAVAPF